MYLLDALLKLDDHLPSCSSSRCELNISKMIQVMLILPSGDVELLTLEPSAEIS